MLNVPLWSIAQIFNESTRKARVVQVCMHILPIHFGCQIPIVTIAIRRMYHLNAARPHPGSANLIEPDCWYKGSTEESLNLPRIHKNSINELCTSLCVRVYAVRLLQGGTRLRTIGPFSHTLAFSTNCMGKHSIEP
jgi:hypothetical protein